jgi:hypothetical protein
VTQLFRLVIVSGAPVKKISLRNSWARSRTIYAFDF